MSAQVRDFMRRLWKKIGVRHLPALIKKLTLFLHEYLQIEIYPLFFSTLIAIRSSVEGKMH